MIYFQSRYPIIYHVNYAWQSQARSKKFPAVKESFNFNFLNNFLLPFQTTEDVVMLNGFGTIVNSLGKRVKPYLPQICGTILWRLNNKSAKVRQQAADLISRIAVVMKTCQVIIIMYQNKLIVHFFK